MVDELFAAPGEGSLDCAPRMVLTLAAVLLVAPAEGLRLDWQAPAACPDGEALRARVIDLVGAEAAGRTRLRARAVVRAEAGRWTMALDLLREGGQDRRTLEDRDCRALAEAAALMIAVAIDPQVRLVGPVPGDSSAEDRDVPADSSLVPLPPGETATGAAPPDRGSPVADARDRSGTGPAGPADPTNGAPAISAGDVPGDRSPDRGVAGDSSRDRAAPKDSSVDLAGPKDSSMSTGRGDRKLQLGLRLGAGLGFARLLPGSHAALDLGLGLEGRLWRVEVAGLWAPPVRGVAASDAGIGGVFRLGAGELRGCAMPGLRGRPLVFPLCVGLQLGAMHGRGRGSGLQREQAARSPWIATRIGAALRWRPRDGRIGLWLGLDAIVALTRPKFVTAGGVLVHEAARIGGQASVGLEIRLR
jgi:hypothetical protein